MKIIKKGKSPADKPKKEICHKCKTHFEYDKSDVNSDRDGSYVVCPVCKSFISADKN